MDLSNLSIRWKLLAGFVGLALVVLLVVLLSVSRTIDNRIRSDIDANFREAGKVFGQLQDIRFRQLNQTATLVAEMPYMKAAISTGDVNTVENQIKQELVDLLHFDPMIAVEGEAGNFSEAADSIGLVMVFDREGRPLGQLRDAVLPDHSFTDRPGVASALNGGAPSQSYIWEKQEQYYNVITIPVFIQDQVIGALSLGYPIRNSEAEMLAELIEYEVSYVVDGNLLATTVPSAADAYRTQLAGTIRETFAGGGSRAATVEMELENDRWLVYILPMGDPGNTNAAITGYYTIGKSLTEALNPLRALQQMIFIIGLGGIVLAVILGITLTNNFTRPINLLLEGIGRIEQNDYEHPVKVVSRDEFGQLTETFNKLVANIRENLREKEILLAEIHHRVKNNLAVITGLLQLESQNADNIHTERILKNSQLRIHSMATVHEMLYQSQDFNNLSFHQFVNKMVGSIRNVYLSNGHSDPIELEIDEVQLNVNQAVPCGLIINELVTNAFKHAYPQGRDESIMIRLQQNEDTVSLVIEDRGVGLPDDFSYEESDTLGFTLVRILAKQLSADIDIDTGAGVGTRITVSFEKENKKGASSSLNIAGHPG
ncbi:MAG: histidine kinase dimerization/phosphoacceptor domain -containing protein [Balneolaceae bacterium]|nr:histidine kinase dimerization/phosphoacceptor domain -containing protein [Balneolaceae bacterium]